MTLATEVAELVCTSTKMADVRRVLQEAVDLYQKHFKSKPSFAAYAPGRVNLIGEHTDYNEGFVLPMVRTEVKFNLEAQYKYMNVNFHPQG